MVFCDTARNTWLLPILSYFISRSLPIQFPEKFAAEETETTSLLSTPVHRFAWNISRACIFQRRPIRIQSNGFASFSVFVCLVNFLYPKLDDFRTLRREIFWLHAKNYNLVQKFIKAVANWSLEVDTVRAVKFWVRKTCQLDQYISLLNSPLKRTFLWCCKLNSLLGFRLIWLDSEWFFFSGWMRMKFFSYRNRAELYPQSSTQSTSNQEFEPAFVFENWKWRIEF